jgi:hypothetical protein
MRMPTTPISRTRKKSVYDTMQAIYKGIYPSLGRKFIRLPNFALTKSRCNGASGIKQNKMIQQFSWWQFTVATGAFTLLWYIGVVLLFYRMELSSLLGGKPIGKETQPLPHRWEKDVETLTEEDGMETENLMGKPKLPEGMSVASTDQIGFAQSGDAKQQQIGLVPDVLQELKEVFAILAKQDGNKKDFFGLMEMVRLNFPAIGSNPNIGRINDFISEHAPFYLSPEELENLWD